MAWEATLLLPPVLLVLLASGSWEQKSELLHQLEGGSVSVKCPYQAQQGSNPVKVWCRQVPERSCDLLVTSPRLPGLLQKPRNSIQDNVSRGYFLVTMTELRIEDSGSYSCGIYKSPWIFIHRNIRLVVSRASTLPTTRSTSGTTTWTSTPSPVTDSPQGSWQFIVTSSTVAVLLLLVLTLLMVLYFRKARRNTGKGKPQCWLRADHPGLSHDTPVPASLRRRLPVPILPTRKLRPVRRSGQDPLGSLALSEIALFGGSRSAASKPNLPKTGCSSPFGSVYFAIFLQDLFFFKILFIYSIEIETASERGNTSRGSGRGRSRLIAEEPDVGLDPRSLGSRPEPKADA
uniref:Ig-like domain-containing protein n=1 Tax=Ursus maritimus TaxID=29073 RepID=A0A452U7C4_URSMA